MKEELKSLVIKWNEIADKLDEAEDNDADSSVIKSLNQDLTEASNNFKAANGGSPCYEGFSLGQLLTAMKRNLV